MYTVFTFWLLLYDRKDLINHLKLLGSSKSHILKISQFTILLISGTAIFIGLAISFILSYIQNTYQILTLDSSIYIVSDIKAILSFNEIASIISFKIVVLWIISNIVTSSQILKKRVNI